MSDDVERLTALLQRAGESLRAERDRAEALAVEVDRLRAENDSLRRAATDVQTLRAENQLAVQRIVTLEAALVHLNNAAAASGPRMTLSPPRPQSAAHRESPSKQLKSARPVPTGTTGRSSSAAAAHAEGQAISQSDAALNRMRRAMAPAPTKEQVDEVIRGMVGEIKSGLRARGIDLHMRRLGECYYECGKKRVHLSVDSRRLVVRCGGGNVDFLEFLERNRLLTNVNH